MNVLIWTPPWPTQGGDLFFGLNAFTKTLLVQAKALSQMGWNVSVGFPEAFSEHLHAYKNICKLYALDQNRLMQQIGGWRDPSAELYSNGINSPIAKSLAEAMRGDLPASVDIIISWETPVPYLQILYPEAMIISQMPGAFARAPYPHTVTFDPNGLYRQGSMYLHAEEILRDGDISPTVMSFRDKCIEIMHQHPLDITRRMRDRSTSFSLLPLQISDHYAFRQDTGFSSQAEFCLAALESCGQDKDVVITQYVSRLYRDTVLTPDFVRFIQSKFPNVIFDQKFDEIPSVSQHILQDADQVVTATSGLGLQAMIWSKPLLVIGNTHLKPYGAEYVITDDHRNRALTFALTHNQPLASKLANGEFLVPLLEELKHRNGRPIRERFPKFTDIDANYDEELLSSFRHSDVEREFKKLGLPASSPSKSSQFASLIDDKKPSLISFDLFDTLVIRGFEAPADLYRFIEIEIARRGLPFIFDFGSKRLAAEIAAREHAALEEISLCDIYNELSSLTGIPAHELGPYMDLEVEIEIAACSVRPLGQAMYRDAEARGIYIVVTSDMYLPRSCIDQILKRTGYTPADVYLSSEVGHTKKSGALFDFILSKSKLPPERIIHVGDNIKTDVKPAESRRITTFHVPRAVEYLSKNSVLTAAFGKRVPIVNLGRSSIIGAISHKLFDDPKRINTNSLSDGDPWLLGYTAVGPLLLGMATWLRKSAIADGVDTLHFLSREGKILKDAFDRIALTCKTPIASNYLFGSRRAIRVAQLSSFEDILELASQTVDRTATVSSLLAGRFGIDAATLDVNLVRQAGYRNVDEQVGNSSGDSARLKKLLLLLQDKILEVARAEGEVYSDYLRSHQLYVQQNFAVVDIGWNANMQGSLGQMLGKPITGYYLASLDAAGRWERSGHTIRAYMGEEITISDRSPILSNRLMLENILCDVSPSIVRVERVPSGGFAPVYAGTTDPKRRSVIDPMQKGALAFVDDVCRTLGPSIEKIRFSPDVTLALMEEFLSRPSPSDAKIFEGSPIEDPFSGSGQRYFVRAAGSKAPSYWKPGERALQKNGAAPPAAVHANPNAAEGTASNSIAKRLVNPVIDAFGSERGKQKFHRDPAAYFADLKNPLHRKIGRALFGKP